MIEVIAILLTAAFFSVVPLLILVTIRESVKRHRQETIKNLETVFALRGDRNREDPLPSFEFVKYKYFLKERARDFSWVHWFASSLPLVAFTFALNVLALLILLRSGFSLNISGAIPLLGDRATPTFVWVVLCAYSGGYLFMARAFFQAINNFDLSPLSFVGAFVNLLAGIVLSLIFVYGTTTLSGVFDLDHPAFFAVILTAFAIGYLPQATSRNILLLSQIHNYKKENSDTYKRFSVVPTEVIDGIDTTIRDRLSDYHIVSVQNLAAVNPLMLFVETPYGIYQIMDWVAQAQLCCSVGPVSLVALWRLGIRTIFDLERAALDPACKHPQLLKAIGAALFAASPRNDQPGDGGIDVDAVVADVLLRLQDPHVLRLRELYVRVENCLGPDARRLPAVPKFPASGTHRRPVAKPWPTRPGPNGDKGPGNGLGQTKQ
jgi:hypothetical protein